MASTIKVDNVQNQPGTNIINKCSTTITIGASSDTVALASGASQTGFGREGSVDWQTAIQTSTPFTAVSGNGYFINTTSGAITMNLPTSPSVGDIVAIKDYAGTFATNNLTIGRGGSNMNGTAADAIRNTDNESLTMVYADATKGWLSVEEGTGFLGPRYVTATGGTPCSGATVCTNYKVHTFTGPGTFCVSCGGNPCGSNTVDYILAAGGGGGGGGTDRGGAGGAGGFKGSSGTATGCYAAGCAPLVGPVSANPVTAQGYPIVVGGGGAGATSCPCVRPGTVGVNSSAFGITVAGGGFGGGSPNVGGDGGSGGGGGYPGGAGGSGNTPALTPSQGNDGSAAAGSLALGAGGGISGCGGTATPTCAGDGGQDINNSITASPVFYAGGGGGGGQNPGATQGSASPGGSGGAGGLIGGSPPHAGFNGPDNHGGGGGGASNRTGGVAAAGGTGGSGVVIIRYKFQ
jgi:hypothetical protein